MKTSDRTFQSWTEDDVIVELNLKETKKNKLLEEWLKAEMPITPFEHQSLQIILKRAVDYISAWNEEELQNKFISHITCLVNFDNLDYFFASFLERKVATTYKGISLKGKVDWMVAIGKGEPRLPFFFLHEYKKEKGQENDPKGQLLATMFTAHILNQTPPQPTLFNPFPKHDRDMPIYGCYIIGRNWFFTVLHKNTYCFSKAYDSTEEEELLKIFQILKKQKEMIINRLKAK